MVAFLQFPTSTLQLGYSVVRRVKAGSTSVQSHVSGREVRVGYWTLPLYEWDLTFEVLRDFPRGAVPSELRRLEGFFFATQGSLTGFTFDDPDDDVVTGQFVGVTDGNSATPYTIYRTYGDPLFGVTVSEPVGVVYAFSNVYLDGIPQQYQLDWTNDFSVPGNQKIFFLRAGPGHTITVDMSYLFWVRFAEDKLDFEKFLGAPGAAYWRVKKLTLMSLRG